MANAPNDYTITATSRCLTANSAAASTFTIQNKNNGTGVSVLLISAATTTAPTIWVGAWEIEPGDGLIAYTVAQLFEGSTNTHLHCKTTGGPDSAATVTFASA